MSEQLGYSEFHPRWYRVRISTWWWLKRVSSLVFIVRELSSLFVAWFVVFLLLLVSAVSRGDAAYQEFLEWAGTPVMLLVNTVTLFFVLFHTVTWFHLAPQAMVVRVGGKRVPGALIAASHYAAWLAVSAFVTWIVLGG